MAGSRATEDTVPAFNCFNRGKSCPKVRPGSIWRRLCHIEVCFVIERLALRQWRAHSTHTNSPLRAFSSCGCWCFWCCVALVAVVLYRQILGAFMANPGLNGLILGVLLIGILLSFRQVRPAVPRSCLGQQFPARRPRHHGGPAAGIAGADGSDPRRPYRPHGDVDTDDAGHPRFDRDTARRVTRPVALYDRASDLSRPARHLLGPDRDRGFGRQGGGTLKPRRRCRLGIRNAARRPCGAAGRHGICVFVLAVRSCRLAGAGLPRSADQPGAEPLLYRSRRLALHHGARHQRRARRLPPRRRFRAT